MKEQFSYGNMTDINNYNYFPYTESSYQQVRQDNNQMMNIFNTNNQVENNKMNIGLSLARPNEGFIQGNMFNNLFEGYMNYRPIRLVPNNEQAELLLNLDIFKFASHEIRLYLDVYPTDNGMIDLFNQYNTRANELTEEYEKNYGPITWSGLSNFNDFSWVSTKWPWEMEEV